MNAIELIRIRRDQICLVAALTCLAGSAFAAEWPRETRPSTIYQGD
jgi:hypothetical protein